MREEEREMRKKTKETEIKNEMWTRTGNVNEVIYRCFIRKIYLYVERETEKHLLPVRRAAELK